MRPHYCTHPQDTWSIHRNTWLHGQVQSTVLRLPVCFAEPPHLVNSMQGSVTGFHNIIPADISYQMGHYLKIRKEYDYPWWGHLSEPFLCTYPSFSLTDMVTQKVFILQNNHQLRYYDPSRRKLAESLLGTFNSIQWYKTSILCECSLSWYQH